MHCALQDSSNTSAEIIVIGAGLAGATAAAVLGAQGRRVMLVDAREACPPVFKAEKIEPDQAQLLRQFGLLEALLPHAGHIREIRSYDSRRLFQIRSIEQYGLFYSDMVNLVRERLPATVQFKTARVTRIANGPDVQRVSLEGGEELTCRLVVVASGLNAELPASLRLKRVAVRKYHSAAIAFTIEPPNSGAFAFDSVTCFPRELPAGRGSETAVDYLTLFPIGKIMRANLFAFPSADDAWTREFLREPERALVASFPNLRRMIGEYRLASKVETSLIHLYRTEGEPPPGVVLIGDSAQNACPSTGMGLSKVFTDVDVLCSEYVPRWLATPGMGREKVAEFWNDARKRSVDEQTLRDAIYRRQARTDASLKWRIHRARLRFQMRFAKPSKSQQRRVEM